MWIAYPCHTLPEGELGRMRNCPERRLLQRD
jgi:hypothetical protein